MIERYTLERMNYIWSKENKFQKFLDVEIANVKALNKFNIVSDLDLENIINNSKFNITEIDELEKITKHDVIAFTRNVSKYLGEEKRWIHYMLTSTDVVDSANGLLLKEANDVIYNDLVNFKDVLKKKAILFKNTPCIGRTHGMHAEITSFGLKWALWYDELNRCIDRFNIERKNVEVIKLSGAVGNFANTSLIQEEEVAKFLNLGFANISTQVLSRDRYASYISSIVLIASLIEKIAFEIRNLSRTEVKEVEEAFLTGQKGSSAMPHKKNPIASENMCGCSRVIKGYLVAVLDNNPLWHERDISHSSAERIILPDITSLIDYMLNRYTKVLDNLVVFEKRMYKNIYLTNGLVFSSRILNILLDKGLSREEAYDLVQPVALKANDFELDFKKLLLESNITEILKKEEIEDAFKIEYYLKNIDGIYKRLNLE